MKKKILANDLRNSTVADLQAAPVLLLDLPEA